MRLVNADHAPIYLMVTSDDLPEVRREGRGGGQSDLPHRGGDAAAEMPPLRAPVLYLGGRGKIRGIHDAEVRRNDMLTGNELRIGQLYWHNPDGEVLKRYNGKYQNKTNATPNWLYQDCEWEEETDG